MSRYENPATTARRWLDAGYLILDTETTGLGNDAEILELAVLDPAGPVLLDTLVKPRGPIPPDASRIHGITAATVEHAPDWADVAPLLLDMTAGRPVVIYNASYDTRLLRQTAAAHGKPWPVVFPAYCAMLLYAERWGEWDDYRNTWKWQRLQEAAQRHQLPAPAAHRALSDCITTLALLNWIADNPDGQDD